ncbi:hypothetical protein [Butyrivibrio sp. ob235]|uniref:hypothetical protein n=1 Tax=Butyrivibrio sp. ob235 TaxID=1761780 RepID=UPI000B8191AE|nr:hypothetical protein [Butyrivibrio sp. ob235]
MFWKIRVKTQTMVLKRICEIRRNGKNTDDRQKSICEACENAKITDGKWYKWMKMSQTAK